MLENVDIRKRKEKVVITSLDNVFRTIQTREEKKTENNHEVTYIDVPQFAAGFPIIMLSETPSIMSVLPYAEASNK